MTTKPQDLAWKREGDDWVPHAGRRKLGRVVPDATYPAMGRPVLSSGRLGGMANLSWCKSVTLDAPARELAWDIARCSAQHPHFPAENEGVFLASSPPIAPTDPGRCHPTGGGGRGSQQVIHRRP